MLARRTWRREVSWAQHPKRQVIANPTPLSRTRRQSRRSASETAPRLVRRYATAPAAARRDRGPCWPAGHAFRLRAPCSASSRSAVAILVTINVPQARKVDVFALFEEMAPAAPHRAALVPAADRGAGATRKGPRSCAAGSRSGGMRCGPAACVSGSDEPEKRDALQAAWVRTGW